MNTFESSVDKLLCKKTTYIREDSFYVKTNLVPLGLALTESSRRNRAVDKKICQGKP